MEALATAAFMNFNAQRDFDSTVLSSFELFSTKIPPSEGALYECKSLYTRFDSNQRFK